MTDRWKRGACWTLGRVACALIIAAALALPAFADDEAGPEDRARIEEVELDDGVWEVDDAVGSDGQEYDLKLDPDTLEIIEKEQD
jgi:uncharacterized membrane protein YkoI